MKTTVLALVGGLAFAGVALAHDPAPQQTAATGPSLKVGIDKATGKLRPLNEAESAALDGKATAANGNNTSLRAGRTSLAPRAKPFPMTYKQIPVADKVTYNGLTSFRAPEEFMSEVTVQRNADGSLTVRENGEVMGTQHAEAGNE